MQNPVDPLLRRAAFATRLQRMLLVALTVFTLPTSYAIDSETVPVLAFRLSRMLPEQSTLDMTLSARSYEDFDAHEREIFEVRYSRDIGANELMAAYNLQFDRKGSPGREHRLWQQFRHQFSLPASTFESSVRLEERYFDANDRHGTRLRVLNRWNKALPRGHLLRLGYEWMFNLKDISAGTQRGVAQDRLIGAIQRNFSHGDRLEFEYQLRYLHIPGQENRLQNQLQLMYVKVL